MTTKFIPINHQPERCRASATSAVSQTTVPAPFDADVRSRSPSAASFSPSSPRAGADPGTLDHSVTPVGTIDLDNLHTKIELFTEDLLRCLKIVVGRLYLSFTENGGGHPDAHAVLYQVRAGLRVDQHLHTMTKLFAELMLVHRELIEAEYKKQEADGLPCLPYHGSSLCECVLDLQDLCFGLLRPTIPHAIFESMPSELQDFCNSLEPFTGEGWTVIASLEANAVAAALRSAGGDRHQHQPPPSTNDELLGLLPKDLLVHSPAHISAAEADCDRPKSTWSTSSSSIQARRSPALFDKDHYEYVFSQYTVDQLCDIMREWDSQFVAVAAEELKDRVVDHSYFCGTAKYEYWDAFTAALEAMSRDFSFNKDGTPCATATPIDSLLHLCIAMIHHNATVASGLAERLKAGLYCVVTLVESLATTVQKADAGFEEAAKKVAAEYLATASQPEMIHEYLWPFGGPSEVKEQTSAAMYKIWSSRSGLQPAVCVLARFLFDLDEVRRNEVEWLQDVLRQAVTAARCEAKNLLCAAFDFVSRNFALSCPVFADRRRRLMDFISVTFAMTHELEPLKPADQVQSLQRPRVFVASVEHDSTLLEFQCPGVFISIREHASRKSLPLRRVHCWDVVEKLAEFRGADGELWFRLTEGWCIAVADRPLFQVVPTWRIVRPPAGEPPRRPAAVTHQPYAFASSVRVGPSNVSIMTAPRPPSQPPRKSILPRLGTTSATELPASRSPDATPPPSQSDPSHASSDSEPSPQQGQLVAGRQQDTPVATHPRAAVSHTEEPKPTPAVTCKTCLMWDAETLLPARTTHFGASLRSFASFMTQITKFLREHPLLPTEAGSNELCAAVFLSAAAVIEEPTLVDQLKRLDHLFDSEVRILVTADVLSSAEDCSHEFSSDAHMGLRNMVLLTHKADFASRVLPTNFDSNAHCLVLSGAAPGSEDDDIIRYLSDDSTVPLTSVLNSANPKDGDFEFEVRNLPRLAEQCVDRAELEHAAQCALDNAVLARARSSSTEDATVATGRSSVCGLTPSGGNSPMMSSFQSTTRRVEPNSYLGRCKAELVVPAADNLPTLEDVAGSEVMEEVEGQPRAPSKAKVANQAAVPPPETPEKPLIDPAGSELILVQLRTRQLQFIADRKLFLVPGRDYVKVRANVGQGVDIGLVIASESGGGVLVEKKELNRKAGGKKAYHHADTRDVTVPGTVGRWTKTWVQPDPKVGSHLERLELPVDRCIGIATRLEVEQFFARQHDDINSLVQLQALGKVKICGNPVTVQSVSWDWDHARLNVFVWSPTTVDTAAFNKIVMEALSLSPHRHFVYTHRLWSSKGACSTGTCTIAVYDPHNLKDSRFPPRPSQDDQQRLRNAQIRKYNRKLMEKFVDQKE